MVMGIWKLVALWLLTDPKVAPGTVEVTTRPDWKPVPVTVSVVVAPGTGPGEMAVMAGLASMVRHPVPGSVPPSVVTVKLPAPRFMLAARAHLTHNEAP